MTIDPASAARTFNGALGNTNDFNRDPSNTNDFGYNLDAAKARALSATPPPPPLPSKEANYIVHARVSAEAYAQALLKWKGYPNYQQQLVKQILVATHSKGLNAEGVLGFVAVDNPVRLGHIGPRSER
jgi:hypothetical protein